MLYFIGCIISLLVLSKLGNSLGRKKTALLSLAFGIVGLSLLLVMQNSAVLMLARFFQGLACGLGSAILSVYIMESGQEKNPTFVKSITGSAVFIGLALGSLLSGGLNQLFVNYTNASYWPVLLLMLTCFVGVCLSIDTGKTLTFTWRNLIPKLSIAKEARPFFPAAFCIFVGTWVMGGYFQAFSSTIASHIFHDNSTLLSGIILSVFMVPNFIGARLSSQFSSYKGKKYGMLSFAICIALMYLSFNFENLALFFIVSMIAGVSQGVCYTAAMQELQSKASEAEKTELMSVIYFSSYGGAAVPNFIASKLASQVSFFTITLGYLLICSDNVATNLGIVEEKCRGIKFVFKLSYFLYLKIGN